MALFLSTSSSQGIYFPLVTLALVARVHSSAVEMPARAHYARLDEQPVNRAMDPRNKCEGDSKNRTTVFGFLNETD
jgi:hypothetical protein